MFVTLKTLVLKTATVAGVKPVTPADRIGLGFGVNAYPADNLSPNPAPEQARPRELSATHPQERRMRAGDDAVPPVGSAGLVVRSTTEPTGCSSAPGVSAGRSASSSVSSVRVMRSSLPS